MKIKEIKNIRFLLKKLTVVALIGSLLITQASHAMFGSFFKPITDKVNSMKRKYETAKTYAKVATVGTAGILSYKKVARPLSKIIFGETVKPAVRTIDRALNVSLLVGGIAGALFFYNKFFSNGEVIRKIGEAKDEIIGRVSNKVKSLKDYMSSRADKADKKLGKIDKNVKNGFDANGKKLDKIDNHLEQRFDQADDKLSKIQKSISNFSNKNKHKIKHQVYLVDKPNKEKNKKLFNKLLKQYNLDTSEKKLKEAQISQKIRPFKKYNKNKNLPKNLVSNITDKIKRAWATTKTAITTWLGNWTNFESQAPHEKKRKKKKKIKVDIEPKVQKKQHTFNSNGFVWGVAQK